MPVIAAIGAPATYALYSSAVIGIASAGLSFYGQQQQAQSAQEMANYNAQVQQNNAVLEADIAKRNSVLQAQGAEYSRQAAMAQYEAGQNNATMLEQQARATEEAARAAASQKRDENQLFLSKQRARYAAAGVVSSEGSPLTVLADTAGRLELGVQNDIYESGLRSRELDWRADLERYNAGFSLLDATQDEYSGDLALWRGDVAQLGIGQANDNAAVTRWSGATEAAGYRLGAAGSLLSGASSILSDGFNYYQKTPRTPKKTTGLG